MENDLLAITSAQIMKLNKNLAHTKNSSSLTGHFKVLILC